MTESLEGLLCFDNNPNRDWRDKVRDAAQRFQARFGMMPDLCQLHLTTFQADDSSAGEGQSVAVDDIEIYPRPDIPRHYFFVAGRRQRLSDTRKPVKKSASSPAVPIPDDAAIEQPTLFRME